jgi:hypothetical protein
MRGCCESTELVFVPMESALPIFPGNGNGAEQRAGFLCKNCSFFMDILSNPQLVDLMSRSDCPFVL